MFPTEIFGMQPADRLPSIIAATATIAYLAYHYLPHAASFRRRFAPPTTWFFARRALGATLLGLVPALVAFFALDLGPTDIGLTLGDIPLGLLEVTVVGALVLPFIALASRKPAFIEHYPEPQPEHWTPELVRAELGSWALYLFGYELFFRGFLLMPLAVVFGVWPAIWIVTALYVAVHLTKNAGEAVGTLPMGVIFAVMALSTGSILGPFLLHVAIAWTGSILAIGARRGAGETAPRGVT